MRKRNCCRQAPHGGSPARDRVKERKARTRRLIQEGAILEKAMPEVRAMENVRPRKLSLAEAVTILFLRWRASGKPGAFLFCTRRAHLLSPPVKQAVVCLRIVRSPRGIAAAAAASRQCHSTCECCCHRLCRRANSLRQAQRIGAEILYPMLPPACANLPRQLCRRDGRRSARPFSLCERETEKRTEVNERWQFTIWKQKWSAGAQAAPPWPLPLI